MWPRSSRLGPRLSRDPASGEPIGDAFDEELALEVGGLAHDPDGAAIQIRWLREALQVGQVITLAVVEADSVDPPERANAPIPRGTRSASAHTSNG